MTGKRILLCCNRTLSLGGIEKALTTFLRAFDTKNNEILLVLNDMDGVLTAELPLDQIQTFCTNTIDAAQFLKDDIRHLRLLQVAKGLWDRAMLRLDRYWYTQIMYLYRIKKRALVFPGHFDCAISFTTDYSDLSMVAAADADKRICFVHGNATKGKRAARKNRHLVGRMDKIYAVSQQCRDLFVSVHPHCAQKVDVLHNVILAEDILQKAELPPEGMISDHAPTLCTVGRLSPEKGQQMIPQAARLLRDSGRPVRWYVVGDGPMRESLERQIQQLGVQDSVILLGRKTNPYPYIKNCDIYVQTSFTEAYCLTVAEARILCKPIVTTDAPGLREQIVPQENGLIVDAMTPQALASGIETLLCDRSTIDRFIQRLQDDLAEEVDPLQKLFDFIES